MAKLNKSNFAVSPVVAALDAYIESNEDLQYRVASGLKTILKTNVKTGVVGPTAIGVVDQNVVFNNGTSCGWNPTSVATVTDRKLVPGIIKINEQLCQEYFVGKLGQHKLKGHIGINNKAMPFEQDFIQSLLEEISNEVDKLLWQGDKAAGTGNMALTDGYKKICTTDFAAKAVAAGASAKATVQALITAADPDVLTAKYGTPRLYCSVPFANEYVQSLITDRIIAWDRIITENGGNVVQDMVIPGTGVVLTPMQGLTGANFQLLTGENNIYVGVDLEGDSDSFDFHWEPADESFHLSVHCAAAAQLALDALNYSTYSK